ncbi:retrovirus-related pol polyprotein from transposon TNT 1-94 [Tanacetum coccineum]
MTNDKVISPGMIRINPFKTYREDKFIPINKVRASVRINSITVSQPHVITKKHVNSDSNGLSSTGVDNLTKTRRPQPRSNTKHDRVPSASKSSYIKNKEVEVEEHHRNLLLSMNKKHMSSKCNNVKLAIRNDKFEKFLGIVRFGNDHDAVILGYGDLQWGNILITRVYFVEGLGYNLFSGGQFCDSDLEVAFRRNTCFVKNLEGVHLLKENCITNLYTVNLHEMAYASPICLMARATSTKSWLWHQRLSQLNFDTVNDLAKNDLVIGLLKFKYHKEHLCPSCEQGKSKKASHPPKPVPNSKKRSKDEAPEEIKIFLKKITVLLQAPVIIVRTDNDTEFNNQVLQEYFNSVGISHQASSVKTPQQNGVVERRNRTLVEAARTILIFSRASLFLWAEAISTAVYNRWTKKIMETMNVTFDDLSAMAFKESTAPRTILAAQVPQVLQTPMTSTTIANTTSTLTNSSSQATNIPSTSQDVDELEPQQQHVQHLENQAPLQLKIVADNVPNAMFDGDVFENPFSPPSTSAAESSSS